MLNLKVSFIFQFLSLLFLPFGNTWQANAADSLQHFFNDATEDSVKAQMLLQFADSSRNSNRKQAIQYYQEALNYPLSAEKRAGTYYDLGFLNWQLGNFENAIGHFKSAAEIYEQLKDSSWLGRTYNNIAASNWGMGNTNEALNYYHTALQIRKAIDDKVGVSKILNNIGLIYQDWRLYDEAFEWHNEALEVALKTDDNNVIAYSFSNIGNCYLNSNKPDNALLSYQTGFKYLLEKDKQNRSSSFFLVHIGEVYNQMGKQDSALYYFRSAKAEANRINNLHRVAIANYHLGEIFLQLNAMDSAKFYIERSSALAADKKYTELLQDNLFALSQISEKEGNTEEAFEYYKQASELKDSLFNAEKISKFTDLQIEYFTRQQKQENLILKQQNEIQQIELRQQKFISRALILAGALILVILFFIARSRISFKKLSSRLEKSERELMRANADKDKFFTIIAHDLKTPFNGLLVTTEMLTSNYDTLRGEEKKKLILLLKESSENMYELLEGLLQWAQVKTGQITYTFEPVNVHENSRKVIDLLSSSAKNKNISIHNHIKKNTFVFADEKSISTILRNLISNAIKFTHPGGNITITASRAADNVEISVIDDGVGMEKSTKEKLFQIAEKISNTGTANESGTGLGLILCKEFIEKNNGKIWVESTPGKGSRFTFSLKEASEPKINGKSDTVHLQHVNQSV